MSKITPSEYGIELNYLPSAPTSYLQQQEKYVPPSKIKLYTRQIWKSLKSISKSLLTSTAECLKSTGHMLDNQWRSGECWLALGFVGIILVCCGVMTLLLAYNSCFILGFIVLGLGLICSLTLVLTVFRSPPITGWVLPRESEYAFADSIRRQNLRRLQYQHQLQKFAKLEKKVRLESVTSVKTNLTEESFSSLRKKSM